MSEGAAPELPGLTFVRRLGEGGYSDVFLYEQELPRRQVAVKVLRVASRGEAVRRRFAAEADTMAGLAGHPNIVPVFAADTAPDGRPYLTMLFCPRATLAERAAREPLGVAEVLRVGIQIGGAVETAHRAHVLHRDIKPANILTDQYDTPRLADFGIAGDLAAGEDDPELGVSVHFAAPEVLYATARPSVASDVYSFAATLWTLLVGRPPFSLARHDTTPELMERVRSASPRPTGRADVPASLERLLVQALNKNPAVRPRSALDLVLALQQVEQELHLPVTRVSVETPETEPRAEAPGGTGTRVRPPAVTGPDRSERPDRSDRPAGTSAAWGSSPVPRRPEREEDVATVRRAPEVAPSSARPPRERVLPQRSSVASDRAAPEPALADRAAPDRDDRTVQRAPAATPGRADDAPPARTRGVRRPVAIAVGVVVVAAAVVVGVVLAGSGDGPSPRPVATTPVGEDSAADQDPGGITPVGPVTVTATRISAATVRFSWTYDGARDDDTYRWQTTSDPAVTTTSTPSVDLPATAGTATCVQVKVVRADGSDAAVAWSAPGCSS